MNEDGKGQMRYQDKWGKGQFKGDIKGGLAGPGASLTYQLYTPAEGAFIINSYGALLGSEASSGNIAVGMCHVVVEARNARLLNAREVVGVAQNDWLRE